MLQKVRLDNVNRAAQESKVFLSFLIVSINLISCAPSIYSSGKKELGPSDIKYQGPLIISKGGTYSGNWESQDPKVPAVSVQTSEPVIIENANIRSRGNLISGFGNRLTVRNVSGYGLNPNIIGLSVGKFVNSEDFISVRVENTYSENTQGLYFRNYRGNIENGDTITILRNKFKNLNGLPSAGGDTYNLDYVIGHPHTILLNDVKRIPNAEIAWNEIINEPGKSLVEENINIYASGGTPGSHIKIHDNYIQGGYNSKPSENSLYAGGGIIVGDGALSNPEDSGYTDVYNNQIISTTNQGIAIAGGTNSNVYNNRLISSGFLADGSKILGQNVGIYVWNSGETSSKQKAKFSDNTVRNNYIAWIKFDELGNPVSHPWWFPDCGTQNNICENNVSVAIVNFSLESAEFKSWIEKVSLKEIKIGRL